MMLNMNQAKERRQKEFETALEKLRGKDVDVSQEAAEIQVLLLPACVIYFPILELQVTFSALH